MCQKSAQVCRLFLIGCLTFAASCATLGGTVAGSGPRVPYPGWVRSGSHFGQGAEAKALFGLGEVRGIRNVALARATADNRARAELAQLLDGFVTQWLSACPLGAATGQETPGATLPQDQAVLVRLLTASNLSAVQIVEHYFHPNDGAVFSLARLELSHIEQHLQASADVPAPIKSCLAEHSASIYKRLQQSQAH